MRSGPGEGTRSRTDERDGHGRCEVVVKQPPAVVWMLECVLASAVGCSQPNQTRNARGKLAGASGNERYGHVGAPKELSDMGSATVACHPSSHGTKLDAPWVPPTWRMACRSNAKVTSKPRAEGRTRTNKRVCARRDAFEAAWPSTPVETRLRGCRHRGNAQMAACTTCTIALSPRCNPTLRTDPTPRASRNNLFHVHRGYERVLVCTARRLWCAFLVIFVASFAPAAAHLHPSVISDPFFDLLGATQRRPVGGESRSRPRSPDPSVT